MIGFGIGFDYERFRLTKKPEMALNEEINVNLSNKWMFKCN